MGCKLLLLLLLSPLILVITLMADEPAGKREKDPPPNQASDASFDKRLPPVLPGEEINDSGRKMKMWSTSGPVPVHEPPSAPKSPGSTRSSDQLPEDLSVIVDQRKK